MGKSGIFAHMDIASLLEKLRFIRRLNGISVKEVSRRTGINRNRVSLIERGKVNPSFGTVVKIAEAVGAKVAIYPV